MTNNQKDVIKYLKDNGRVEFTELCEALGKEAKQLNPVITGLGTKGPKAKGLVDYEKVTVEGEDKPVKYVFLTDAGKEIDLDAEE